MGNQLFLGEMEKRFAEIIWNNVPISSSELVKIASKELDWKRTTTHTVIRKLCDKKIFNRDENGMVTALLSRDEFFAKQWKQFVDTTYGGSLTLFVAGFVRNQKLSEKDVDEIIALLRRE